MKNGGGRNPRNEQTKGSNGRLQSINLIQAGSMLGKSQAMPNSELGLLLSHERSL